MKIKHYFIILAVIVVAGFLLFWAAREVNEEKEYAAVYKQDAEIPGDFIVQENESVLIKNGAWLTVAGDLKVNGDIVCTNGPLNLIVQGDLQVTGTLKCERSENLNPNDIGQGINLVAMSDIEFTDSSYVITNGHVQLVDDKENLVTTQEALENLYEDTAIDEGEGLRVGPFIPIEFEEGETTALLPQPHRGWFDKVAAIFVKSVHAQEPARDIDNLPVANTVKIRGTWIVGGWPAAAPPSNLTVPTPPQKVKHIILNFNFGPGRDVQLVNFTLSGPDGRYGKDDLRNGCNASGDNGENAFRFRVLAQNLTVNNFTLYMGSGGDGGSAETKKDCDPGVARGGDGGEPGNFKMIGSSSFNIVGKFDIFPGKGGRGGDATAFGKDGKDGCPGEAGKDARAYGGQGGDNKKGLKVKGTVNGIANITIHDIEAGNGGNATAIAGWGGVGTGGNCDGGQGGKATAEGGRGGNAASKTVASHGGDGGDADTSGGDGGFGGTGDAKTPGGDGGRGGNAVATPGAGGTGKTTFGNDGNKIEEGGNGGNGGDGCPEGKGADGGSGETSGQKGTDGKNICPVPPKAGGGVKAGNDVKPEPKKDNSGKNPVALGLNPAGFTFEHKIGETKCPTPIGTAQVSGTEGYTWKLADTAPAWLNIAVSGSIPGSIALQFSCQLDKYETQQLHTLLPVQQYGTNGQPLGDPVNLEVTGYIQGQ